VGWFGPRSESPSLSLRFLAETRTSFDFDAKGKTKKKILVAVVVVMFSIAVRMRVAPVPVIRLLPLARPLVLMRVPVVFGKIDAPGAVLVVIPVVIVLVVPVVDADLNASLLRHRIRHHRKWRRYCGSEKQRSNHMWSMHVVSKFRMSAWKCGRHQSAPGVDGLMSHIAHTEPVLIEIRCPG